MKKSELHDFIKEIIRKIGDEYAVYPKSGGKRLGTHSTRKAAEKQLTAIHLNKEAVEPNFDFEWGEATRYPEFKKLGKGKWIELAKTGKAITITSAKDINNTDANEPNAFKTLDPNKQKRALAQLKSGNVEMPIVALYPDGYKELIGGNTRLTAMMAQNKKATIWQFEVPDEILEEGYVLLSQMKPVQTDRVEEAGIPRTALPQIHTKDIKDQYMYREGNILLSQMKPVQTDRVEEDFEKAVQSIQDGTVKPIMLDKRGFIVNGHHRYDAYKALGYERAPAVVVNASLKELMIKFTNESLHNWFNKEDWVRITTAGDIAGPCGTSKNKKNPDRCLPRAKAQSLSKAERAATARKKKKAGATGKQVVSNTKKAKVTREMKEQWPEEVPSRHGDIIFKLVKVMPDRAKYALIDAETGKEWELGYRVYSNPDQLKAHAQNTIKPQKGRQSSHFGTKEDVRNLVVGLIYEAKGIEVLTEEDDRCTRLAKQKYDTWPSAYASGAVVRCRRGEIWKKKS